MMGARWLFIVVGLLFSVGAWAQDGVDQGPDEDADWPEIFSAEKIKQRAEAGNVDAQVQFGTQYLLDVSDPESLPEAKKWLTLAAEQGNMHGQYWLGLLHMLEHAPKNVPEAVKWYIRAAEQGHAEAQYKLGVLYDTGDGVPKNMPEAVKWFMRAAEQGDAEAQYNLGVLYRTADGIPRNVPEAVKWYMRAAEQGNADAQNNLGSLYARGDGIPKNVPEAVKWYLRAAEQGNASAQFNLGGLYARGDGIPKNMPEAVKWYIRAAEQGGAEAQYNLGVLYYTGEGVPKNVPEAVKWYLRAAEQGNASAQFNLGGLYARGDGIPKNVPEAVKWSMRAAEQGNADAQFRLGVLYGTGEGVPKNATEAAKWFTRAAEQGEATAQYSLSLRYFLGEGIPQNFVFAYYWANLSAAGGDANAGGLRDDLAPLMTRDQVAQAQNMSLSFQPKVWLAVPDAGETPSFSGPSPQSNDAFGTPSPPLRDGVQKELVGFGSGFFITKSGYFVTNDHVVASGRWFQVKTARGVFDAAVVSRDPTNDLAILKLEGKFPALHVRGSTGVGVAERVATVGYPNPTLQGLLAKYSSGDIAAVTGIGDDPRYFQISVPVQPGNSGGPLVDSAGSVIGVVVAKLDGMSTLRDTGQMPENVNYAVKATLLLNVADSVPGLSETLLTKPAPKKRNASSVAKSVEAATGMVLVFQ